MFARARPILQTSNWLQRAPARCLATESKTITSFFQLFPKNFPHGGPPEDSLIVNPKSLRREYRVLQSENHPDILIGSAILNAASASPASSESDSNDSALSSVINRAYTTLRNPYARVAHFIQLEHPEKLDITQDDVSKKLIANFQSSSPESSMEYKDMLMTVLEAHEALELAGSESELDDLSVENDERIKESEKKIDDLIQEEWPIQRWNDLMMEAIRLKYWVNIQNGIKEWEPGKPVHLTH
ncbi:molecular chaperone [Scheffersomyces xylosifermentans]|uniref:molecular chaperone n=1 Tax=Scheffersomyces xylosifermentans TaxID=1304137 RepID=UPI00315CE658